MVKEINNWTVPAGVVVGAMVKVVRGRKIKLGTVAKVLEIQKTGHGTVVTLDVTPDQYAGRYFDGYKVLARNLEAV